MQIIEVAAPIITIHKLDNTTQTRLTADHLALLQAKIDSRDHEIAQLGD